VHVEVMGWKTDDGRIYEGKFSSMSYVYFKMCFVVSCLCELL